MIRQCKDTDFESILRIVNDGAQAYRGVIPADCYAEPYMPAEDLRHEIAAGVKFWAYEDPNGNVVAVMGIQNVEQVTLIRHAYVRTESQHLGIGGRLLTHLRELARGPILVGAWAAADWAVRFYEGRSFQRVAREQKVRLLKRYWTVPDRQIETSVVLMECAHASDDRSWT